MKFDLLLQHCADFGVEVEYDDLGNKRHGEYWHDLSLVVLNRRNTGAQMVAALAHEVGHMAWAENGKTARCARADEAGASLIIAPWEYEAAESAVGSHAGALADELGVTRRMVLAWRRWYARTHPPRSCEAD